VLGLLVARLGLSFAGVAVAVIVAGQPQWVDGIPHCAWQLGEPLTLWMGHRSVVADAVLLLQAAPFFREFASDEFVPTDRGLLLEKSFVAGGVRSGVNRLGTEPTEKAFPKNVQ
jgi:hypothetical protein